ncbi:hypothetical protein ABT039_35705 [Streptomyces lasiicapitis]|uniref:hypothetical protein n=1 Tax=Streptomyces lasiicapitis TaxID=1923961 RepID=UPI00332EB303
MVVFSFVLAALLAAMGCVKADWVRALRRSSSPSASELSDGAFALGRVALFATAAFAVYSGVQLGTAADNAEWNNDELTSAVGNATYELDGMSRYGEVSGDSSGFDDEYARLVEDEVVEHGGGDAPQTGVTAAPAGTNSASAARYHVTASGASVAFCVHVERKRTKEHDYKPPGVGGGEGSVTLPSYRFAVTSREGEC